ncbi:MAG: hypothetical protein SGCHY_001669 [Lobulomycetales sp.]
MRRLVVIYLSFAPIFILLSVSYEALFFFCFAMTMTTWLFLEKRLYVFLSYSGYYQLKRRENAARSSPRLSRRSTVLVKDSFRLLTTSDLRTGNIASVASFSASSVYRFTTLFDPFLMGSLLIFKIMIPFFILSAVLRVIGKSIALPPFSIFLVVLSTTDIMTLNFFFLVRDHGSWLEIGTTIT